MSKGAWVREILETALDQEASGEDPLARLASLEAPTANIEKMLAEIEAGRK